MSTPSVIPQASAGRRRRVATRDEAIAACIALLEETGAEGLSMRNLAARLHVSLPTVYTLVDSREHLVEEVLARQLGELLDAANDDVAGWAGAFGWVSERAWIVALLRHVPVEPHRRLCERVAAARPGLAEVAKDGDGLALLQAFLVGLEAARRAVDLGRATEAGAVELLQQVTGAVTQAG
ncbi:MAG: TetR family transcriptional regulator [Acidimicrobiia bacterium]|nr:TetR family transcriptional regulator [Acidimicrobiia bacterium]